ncbi:methyl-accepting chemotaxis protein [Halobacteroides halobius DSM 5150]|uniref:Methyl-accepting chemotaxis protein n=1 Tax=Halobacteroides halobius (strain ATCC 35273 / DSM 5150 / MD-1) TaxID=748449 RepID=L0KA53_HALHC|nr:methyl-accepting chemotaxis protein [Halobacteroides halobius]AGB40983.1 methyl-accepting chemotaxis protein [Halobacteroides halobius DSM 5150]
MQRVKINLMTKLLTCSIIVILFLGGIVYYGNHHLTKLNQALEKLDAQHKDLKNINQLTVQELKPIVLEMMRYTKQVDKLATELNGFLLKSVVIMGAITILLGLVITWLITIPIKRLIKGAKKIANGDLTTTIEVNTRDEIEELADIFNWMTESLRELIVNIDQESEQVNSASQELSAISQEVAAITDTQAVSVEENLKLIQEFNNLIEETKKDIEYITEITTQTSDLATKGVENNSQLVQDMEKIDKRTLELNQIIDEVDDSAQEINEVIETIDDIAEETNILALNAAIEAARSDKEGQGFAVVAEEIRKLANDVKKSTLNIEELINKLQVKTKKAVKNSNQNYKLIKKGTTSTLETVDDFNQIKENIEEITQQMLDVKSVTGEEVDKLERIVDNTKTINEIIQGLSSSAKNTAISSNRLKDFAQNLDNKVEEFRV